MPKITGRETVTLKEKVALKIPPKTPAACSYECGAPTKDLEETANQESINALLLEKFTAYIEQQSVGSTQMSPVKRKTSAERTCEYRLRKKAREDFSTPVLTYLFFSYHKALVTTTPLQAPSGNLQIEEIN